MFRRQKRLGEILIGKGLITEEQLKSALEEQARSKEYLGAILVRRKFIKESALLDTFSEQFNLPLVDLKYRYFDWKFVKDFSPSLILDYHCFPIAKDDWTVTIAITNPLDVWALKKAEEESRGLKLRLVLTSEEDMGEAIQRYRQYIQRNIPRRLF
jgi:type IV pilus assembly protein PilB